MAAAVAKTMVRPWWNVPEMRFGKKVFPVMVAWAWGERVSSTPVGARSVGMGVAPRNAANTVDTAGSCEAWCAAAAVTPWAVRREESESRPRVTIRTAVTSRYPKMIHSS